MLEETTLKVSGLVVAVLAAFAGLMNALVALYNAWREHRWLRINSEQRLTKPALIVGFVGGSGPKASVGPFLT
jgi:hypothetical protein